MKEFNIEKTEDLSYMFAYVDMIKFDFKGFNTENVKNMSHMFYGSYLEEIDLTNFNTQKVKDMSYMFGHCEFLNSLNLVKSISSK